MMEKNEVLGEKTIKIAKNTSKIFLKMYKNLRARVAVSKYHSFQLKKVIYIFTILQNPIRSRLWERSKPG